MIVDQSGVTSSASKYSSRKYDVGMYYPVPLTGKWVSHTFLSLATGFAEAGARVAVGSCECAPGEAYNCDRIVLPRLLYRSMCRARIPVQTISSLLAFPAIRNSCIAYLWPGTPVWMYRRLRRQGRIIVAEMINCHAATSRSILREVYEDEGLPKPTVSRRSLSHEVERLDQAHFIFSPSSLVSQSLIDHGVPESKILRSSYGYSASRISAAVSAGTPSRPFTVLFLGSGILRKGLHILLRAWREIGSEFRLLIAGRVSADIVDRYKDVMSLSSVEVLGHVEDIAGVMNCSDAFVLPSFEEGSPLVIYEAIASGLPVIVSPMAAGDVIRHESEGLIVDPFSATEIVEAIRRLGSDHELHSRLSRQARLRSSEYSWPLVARRRLSQLQAAYATECANAPQLVSRTQ